MAAPHDLSQGTSLGGQPLATGSGAGVPGSGGPPGATGWTTGRVVSAAIGAVLAVCALGALSAGGAAAWVDATQRHGGYVHLGTARYTTAGHVRLAASRRDGDLVLSVEDTGAGLDSEDPESIFQAYQRGRAGQSDSDSGGSGLGLAIVDRL